ncbi:cyclopropane-fatty-acyl-phospholipid synthase family protein [Bacteriovorax sp. Seq25_V]|uniref:SAM-dependent methyltransferase n=1 Tax=Bacteriovorax sp. Seq25_V TaxID=1201288 RepID=UPI00038A2DBF|nr:cyclopropane-fatty-acyl-phospholipid synthase family protein [Bacteriovorax sp. Seq25_V]EQC45982.1 cyclopropane-fatty-acyl-phospholipid synthase [Bacteriovorax sp. Seq25_V]
MIATISKALPSFVTLDSLVEKGVLPDFVLRYGIRSLLKERLSELEASGMDGKMGFINELKKSHVAIMEELANVQHYEVPTDFFKLCLGKRLKYSCAYYETGDDLNNAEDRMFEKVIERAGLQDGQKVLELGCGWGSFCLYLARKFPNSTFVAISNSKTQKIYIDSICEREGIKNLEIRTANVANLELEETFDRIVSVEMFEHMRNYKELLNRIHGWLNSDGKLFIHIFCHREFCYPYEVKDDTDWMAKYFFSGGIMPSYDIFEQVGSNMKLASKWKVNGYHYHRTCEDWLKNMDANKEQVFSLFEKAYPPGEAKKWFNYWRVFYLACSELFKYDGGDQWFVGHFLLEK